MAAYAQLITHSPEQVVQWREIASSNPSRVARTLGLRIGRSTKEGDTQADIYPAMAVLKELTKGDRNDADSRVWADLVDAGIADVLCKNVSEMVTSINYLPDMPMDLLDKVKKEIQSSYFLPLEVLCNATCCFLYPPTRTDKKVIAALRKNWSTMMDRIWNEPENTLRPEDSHIKERMVVAQTIIKLIITDPTFLSTFYERSDLTVQIIARHWKHAIHDLDITLTASILHMIIEPQHPRHIAYVRSNGLESATAQLLSKIFVGVGPSGPASRQKQAKALMAGFADHLVRITGRPAAMETEFVTVITYAARKDGAEPELAKTLLKSTPFWNAMFRLLKKLAKPTTEEDTPQRGDSETGKHSRLQAIGNIVGVTSSVLHNASFDHPRECEPLARIWANENFFGALEEVIELLVEMKGMTMQLSRLGSLLDTTCAKGTPSLVSLLRTQFPRWRLLGTLIRHDMKRQFASGPPPFPPSNSLPAADSNIWDHSAWQCFASLQSRCVDLRAACGRRGCDKGGQIPCRCEVVKYCSEACQTKDAKDHTLVCGQMALVERAGIQRTESRSASSSPVQSRAGGKQKKKPPVVAKPSKPDPPSQSNGLEELD